jgi:hypothetical protein
MGIIKNNTNIIRKQRICLIAAATAFIFLIICFFIFIKVCLLQSLNIPMDFPSSREVSKKKKDLADISPKKVQNISISGTLAGEIRLVFMTN